MKTSPPPRRAFVSVLSAVAVLAAPCHAAAVIFNINATGAQETSNGDPDGTAIGTLTLNDGDGTGTTGSATFNITLNNIDLSNLTGHHVHQAPAGTNGGIVLDFGDPDLIRTGSVLSGTISNLSAATITGIFSNPSGFYYNLHNSTHPGGAVRDQLQPIPEPAAALLGGFGVLGLLVRRKKA